MEKYRTYDIRGAIIINKIFLDIHSPVSKVHYYKQKVTTKKAPKTTNYVIKELSITLAKVFTC